MASDDERSPPPSSAGSTIDDPNMTDDETGAWGESENERPAKLRRPSPPERSSPSTKPTKRKKMTPVSAKRPAPGMKRPRKSKGAPAKGGFAWIHEGPQDGTEDEGSVVTEAYGKRSGWVQKKSTSPRNSDADTKHHPTPATTVGTRRQANGTIGSVYSGNKIRHLKKEDGVPLWRKDIQYEFLRTVFDDKTPVFTRISDGQENCNFADIYIDAMARSSKTSKVLKDKLQSDRSAAQNMAMICLLVNVGRMNTTLNFFPEMRAQLRTYHSIPSLQAHQDPNAYKQLQDAPRLKSILKGASEDTDEPRTAEAVKAHSIPRTNPVNLIFVLSQYAPKISELHFSASVDFFDLVIRHTISSKSRAKAFLWLMWWYLQSNFSKEDALNNPFGPGSYEAGGSDSLSIKVPEFEHLTEEQGNAENVDPVGEIAYGEEKQKERKRILEEDEAENKILKRVKKSAVADDGSDYDSPAGRSSLAQTTSPAVRDSLGFAVLNPNLQLDPSTSRLGGQADSLDDDWEPVNPHPGRGRYKRVKHKDREAALLLSQTPAMTTSSGRMIIKTSKAQSHQSIDPGTPDGGVATTPQPPGAAHPILHQFGSSTDAIAKGDAPSGSMAGTATVHRRPRPLTAHQLAVEANRRARVEFILATKKREVFAQLKAKREKSNFILKAAQRIQNLPLGYDSEDEATSWGMGGLGPNPNGGEEDDFGEEAESWMRVLLRARRRLDRWSGDGLLAAPSQAVDAADNVDAVEQPYALEDGEEVDGDAEMDDPAVDGSSPAPPEVTGLDDIDKSLLAERSDDEMGDDESEDASGDDSDVEMD